MKKIKTDNIMPKTKKRIASFITAIAISLVSLPVSDFSEQYAKVSYQLRAWAVDGGTQRLSTIKKFIEYVESYGSSNIYVD